MGENGAVPGDSERLERIRRLCDKREIVAEARERTRYPLIDRIDDAELERRVCAVAQADGTEDAPELLDLLHREAGRLLRGALIATLTDRHELERVVAEACDHAAIADCTPQVTYCVVVLCQKADPARSRQGGPRVRTYLLDIGQPGFDEQLQRWAREIATNVAMSRKRYRAVFEEFRRFEITTLRALVRVDEHDVLADLADTVADKLAAVIADGLPLEDMSLAAARDVQPTGREYVFQSPLGRWVTTTKNRDFADRRRLSPETDPRARAQARRRHADESAQPPTDEQHAALVDFVDRVAGTRALLDEAIAAGAGTADAIAGIERPSEADRERALRFRAELDFVVAGLRRERRLLGQMLAYVILGLVPSPKRHAVAIVSLRARWLAADVREHLAERMRAVLDNDDQPVPALVAKAAQAARNGVPANRPKELQRLREDRPHRAARFAWLATYLDELPAVVDGDLEAIAAAVPDKMDASSVKATRNQAADELGALDPTFARSFRRYAMKDLRLGRGHGLA